MGVSPAVTRGPTRGYAAYAAVALCAAIGPGLYWNGGMLDRETVDFIRQYTGDRPLVQKVFDPYANDYTTYQARELSYFFDYVDATVYTSVMVHTDPSLLVPLSAVATPLLLALVLAWGVSRTTRDLDPITAALVFACVTSSFVVVSTLGLFYRSGKPLLAPLVLAYLFHVQRLHQARMRTATAPGGWRTREGLIACAIAIAAGLLDRQGVFYVLLACGVLLVHVKATRQLKDLLAGTGAALFLLQVYNFLLAPFIIQQLNGYWPSHAYQRFSSDQLVRVPALMVSAADLLLENVVAILGGVWWITVPWVVAFVVVGSLAATRNRGQAYSGQTRGALPARRLWVYVLLVAFGHVLMFALMIAKHPSVYDSIDHRYWYYTFSFATVLLFGVVLGLDAAWAALGHRGRWLMRTALLAVAISNVTSLPTYERLMRSGDWYGPVFEQSDLLKASLRRGAPDPRLIDAHLVFYEFANARRRPVR